MIAIGPAATPPSEKELLAALKDPISKLLKEEIAQDVEPERVWQLRNAQKADFFWRQLQFLAPQMADGGIAIFSAIGAPSSGGQGDRENNSGLYDYVINIYRGYGRKFISVLGQRKPNIKARPKNPDDEGSLKAARMADVAASILHAQWDLDVMMLELALDLWKTGTVFAYTPWVTDGAKYGVRDEPQIESQQVPMGPPTHACQNCGASQPHQGEPEPPDCPNCGNQMDQQDAPTMAVPQVTGSKQYANGSVECYFLNQLYVHTPFFVKSVDDTPWLEYSYDEYKAKLLKTYPDLRKDMPQESGESESASQAVGTMVRDTAASPLGVPTPHRQNRWSYRRIWLKPEVFELVKEDSVRQSLQENYPDGVKVTLVQNKVVAIDHEKLTDVWGACKPETSEFIYADGLGMDMIPIQEIKNDMTNIAHQTLQSGMPKTFVNPQVVDVVAWEQRSDIPNAIIPVLPQAGTNLAQSFWQTQPSQFSSQMLPWAASVENDGRIAVGTTEAIYGAQAATETAHESELNKNAALQQLGTTYVYIRKFIEKITYNAARQLSRYGVGTMQGSRKTDEGYQSMVLDLSQLQEDGWHYESEEAFPMTHAEQRAYLMWLLGMPDMANQLGITHPRNIPKLQDLLGFTGLTSPNFDDHEKAQEIIGDLINGAPIQQPSPDGSTKTVPSVPIEDFDNHAVMATEAFAWCNSAVGRKAKRDRMDGYQNVVAWGMAHQEAAAPPAAPPPPPQPRLSISTKLNELDPQQAQTVLGDFNLLPGSPPAVGPAPPSNAAVPGQANAPVAPQQTGLPPIPPMAPPPQPGGAAAAGPPKQTIQ